MAHLLLLRRGLPPYVRFRHLTTTWDHVSATRVSHATPWSLLGYRQRPRLIRAKKRTGSFLEQRRQKL